MRLLLTSHQSIRWFFAELIVVIVGILLAFQVEEWRTERSDRIAEQNALEQIYSELEEHVERNQYFLDEWERQVDAVYRLRNYLTENEQRTEQELGALFASATSSVRWQSTPSTFQILRENGQLHIITNEELQRSLVFYYDVGESYLADIATVGLNARDSFLDAAMIDINQDISDATDNNGYRYDIKISSPIDHIPSNPDFFPRLGRLGFLVNFHAEQLSTANQILEDTRAIIESHLGVN